MKKSFNKLAELYSNNQSYAVYRSHLRSVNPPCVPFMFFSSPFFSHLIIFKNNIKKRYLLMKNKLKNQILILFLSILIIIIIIILIIKTKRDISIGLDVYRGRERGFC